jgi:hypothetical protein
MFSLRFLMGYPIAENIPNQNLILTCILFRKSCSPRPLQPGKPDLASEFSLKDRLIGKLCPVTADVAVPLHCPASDATPAPVKVPESFG